MGWAQVSTQRAALSAGLQPVQQEHQAAVVLPPLLPAAHQGQMPSRAAASVHWCQQAAQGGAAPAPLQVSWQEGASQAAGCPRQLHQLCQKLGSAGQEVGEWCCDHGSAPVQRQVVHQPASQASQLRTLILDLRWGMLSLADLNALHKSGGLPISQSVGSLAVVHAYTP